MGDPFDKSALIIALVPCFPGNTASIFPPRPRWRETMLNSILRITGILLVLVVWTSMAAARTLPEEPTLTPGSDQPLPFQSRPPSSLRTLN